MGGSKTYNRYKLTQDHNILLRRTCTTLQGTASSHKTKLNKKETELWCDSESAANVLNRPENRLVNMTAAVGDLVKVTTDLLLQFPNPAIKHAKVTKYSTQHMLIYPLKLNPTKIVTQQSKKQ